MKKFNKFKPKAKKLEKWQVWAIIGASALFVLATILFVVLFYRDIFTENVLVWCLVALFIIFSVGGTILCIKLNKKG